MLLSTTLEWLGGLPYAGLNLAISAAEPSVQPCGGGAGGEQEGGQVGWHTVL